MPPGAEPTDLARLCAGLSAAAGRDGELAVLARGPAEGTEGVAVGAAEIYGTEFEPGH